MRVRRTCAGCVGGPPDFRGHKEYVEFDSLAPEDDPNILGLTRWKKWWESWLRESGYENPSGLFPETVHPTIYYRRGTSGPPQARKGDAAVGVAIDSVSAWRQARRSWSTSRSTLPSGAASGVAADTSVVLEVAAPTP